MKSSVVNILALGDSYTIGEGVHPTESWPFQLAELLRKENREVEQPTIIATTGWTTGELLHAIKQQNLQRQFQLVFLQIGVNNQYRRHSADEYRKEFIVLLKEAIRFAGNDKEKVVVLSIPDWGNTPFAEGKDKTKIADEINAFNTINKEVSLKAGVTYVDVTAISRMSSPELASDGLHPSGKMYARWVNQLLPVLQNKK